MLSRWKWLVILFGGYQILDIERFGNHPMGRYWVLGCLVTIQWLVTPSLLPSHPQSPLFLTSAVISGSILPLLQLYLHTCDITPLHKILHSIKLLTMVCNAPLYQFPVAAVTIHKLSNLKQHKGIPCCSEDRKSKISFTDLRLLHWQDSFLLEALEDNLFLSLFQTGSYLGCQPHITQSFFPLLYHIAFFLPI